MTKRRARSIVARVLRMSGDDYDNDVIEGEVRKELKGYGDERYAEALRDAFNAIDDVDDNLAVDVGHALLMALEAIEGLMEDGDG